jgi:hypothetical protein
VLLAEGGVVAYGRRLGSATLVVLLNSNFGTTTIDLSLSGYLAEGTLLSDVWADRSWTVIDGSARGLEIAARDGMILQAA